MPESHSMAERIAPKPVDKKARGPMVESISRFRRRQLVRKLKDSVVHTISNAASDRVVQSAAALLAVGSAAKLAHDNWIIEEDQTEKLRQFPPNRVFIGTVSFKAGEPLELRATPRNEDQGANSINAVKLGEYDLMQLGKDDEIVLTNPLALDITTRSGIRTTWFQMPDALAQGLLAKNHLTAYASLGAGKTNGSFYELIGQDEKSYLYKNLRGEEKALPKDQAQVYRVQKSK